MNRVDLDIDILNQWRHDYLKMIFGFPEYYGKNLDALYDCLGDLGDTEIHSQPDVVGDRMIVTALPHKLLQCSECLTRFVCAAAERGKRMILTHAVQQAVNFLLPAIIVCSHDVDAHGQQRSVNECPLCYIFGIISHKVFGTFLGAVRTILISQFGIRDKQVHDRPDTVICKRLYLRCIGDQPRKQFIMRLVITVIDHLCLALACCVLPILKGRV